MHFDKYWRDKRPDAGPLPALFQRETAESIDSTARPSIPSWHSGFPINDANNFTGLRK